MPFLHSYSKNERRCTAFQILPVLKFAPPCHPSEAQTTITSTSVLHFTIITFFPLFPLIQFLHQNQSFVSNKPFKNATPPYPSRTPPQNFRTALPDLRPQPQHHPGPCPRRLGPTLKTTTYTHFLLSLSSTSIFLGLLVRHRHQFHHPLRNIE